MLRSLFARLTPHPAPAAPLFTAAVAIARRPDWYVRGEIADSIDGRFAVLATVLALITVRLEQGHVQARNHSAALVERFVEAMDAEHRQMGVSDPALGKQVRHLVGALANRTELWRDLLAAEGDCADGARASLYRGAPPSEAALSEAGTMLNDLWGRLTAADDDSVIEGKFG